MNQQTTNEPKNFEEALTRLEAIASALDRNEAPLAEALYLCSEAALLTRYCREQLENAEGKLEKLIEAANGDCNTVPLNDD